MKIKIIFSIVAFFLVSLFIRVYGLENSPASLGFDEAGLGYNAYTISVNSKDEFGNFLPLSLRSFNDYKPALYSYLAIPGVKLFGLSQTTTRLPSAVAGAIAVVVGLLIFKKITQVSWVTSLLIYFFIGFLPWRIHFSRVALEANLAMLFFSIAFLSILYLKEKKIAVYGLILSSVLAIYTYHSARLALPLLILLSVLDPLSNTLTEIWKNKKTLLRQLIPLLAILVLSIPIFKENGADVLTRFNQTNIFAKYYPYAPKEVLEESSFRYLTNNPLYYLVGDMVGRVFAYLSPRNLGLTAYHWIQKSAMVIVDNGMFGFLGATFLVFGLTPWIKKIKNKNHRLILYGIVAGAFPAALTWEWYHPFRSLNLFPLLEVITGLGILAIIGFTHNIKGFLGKAVLMGIVIIMFISCLFNWQNELNYSVWVNNGEFQPGGYKEGAKILKELYDKYPVIYIDTPHAQSYVFFLHYLSLDPKIIQSTTRNYLRLDGFSDRVFDFGKFKYRKFNWPSDKNMTHTLFWTSSEVKEPEINSTPNAKLYKIYDPFGYWAASIITKD